MAKGATITKSCPLPLPSANTAGLGEIKIF